MNFVLIGAIVVILLGLIVYANLFDDFEHRMTATVVLAFVLHIIGVLIGYQEAKKHVRTEAVEAKAGKWETKVAADGTVETEFKWIVPEAKKEVETESKDADEKRSDH